jgi:hypothetical protein
MSRTALRFATCGALLFGGMALAADCAVAERSAPNAADNVIGSRGVARLWNKEIGTDIRSIFSEFEGAYCGLSCQKIAPLSVQLLAYEQQ